MHIAKIPTCMIYHTTSFFACSEKFTKLLKLLGVVFPLPRNVSFTMYMQHLVITMKNGNMVIQ